MIYSVNDYVLITDNFQGVVGVTKNTDLHIVKVFGDNCSWFYASGLIAAIDECASVGSDIVSMSLGGGGPSAYERDEMQKHFEEDGMLLIAAAGNGGNTALSYPASYDSVISVAAVNSAGDHVSFSQRNSQVEVAAPGKYHSSCAHLNIRMKLYQPTHTKLTYPVLTSSMIYQERVSGRLFHQVDIQTTTERLWPHRMSVV